MKRFHFLLLFLFYFSTIGAANNTKNYLSLENFSVAVPQGWIVQHKEKKVLITMRGQKCEDIYISISYLPTKSSLSLEDMWKKMKPLMISNVKVIYEGEEEFSNAKWKKLEILEPICDNETKKVILFTLRDKSKYIMHFVVPKEHFEKIFPIFNLLKQSFKFK